ncbi:PASTA domain-containing protein, partial [Actinoplanes sp. NPDC024001]|uniref:Stk1 family PASTA domain-containing Ser/Thr kinase n=1 Tax=Actinoplanes sp. NPDC024001 TaxID=3154598 RepID=UPI00340FBE4D
LLGEVQALREGLGAASVETALLRQVPSRAADATSLVPTVPAADATAVVPPVPAGTYQASHRPSWARLPEQGGRAVPHRRAAAPPPGGFFSDRRRVVLTSLIALMAVVILGSTWWVTLGRYTDAPTLVNMTSAQATAYAKDQGFEILVGDGVYSETVPKDSVVNQNPGPQQKIVKGDKITVNLSLGPEVHPVPDVVGIELAAAKAELESLRLKVKEGKSQYSDTAPEGVVISTDPKAGEQLKPGATVTVVLSKGRAPITVPNLVGKNINEARGELQRLGLNALERPKDSDKPADEILAQSIKPGTGVAKNTEITLDVSNGPPLIVVPDVMNQPCQQAAATLQGANLRARLDVNPNGFVRLQNPGANTPVPPQTEIALTCL